MAKKNLGNPGIYTLWLATTARFRVQLSPRERWKLRSQFRRLIRRKLHAEGYPDLSTSIEVRSDLIGGDDN
jgi:hypothetical protein